MMDDKEYNTEDDGGVAKPRSKDRVLNRQSFYTGDAILNQGTDAYCAYYIEKGRVKVSVREGDQELKVSELGPGAIFGEMALITKTTRSATVKALEETTVTIITREDVEKRLAKVSDKAIVALLRIMVARLREANMSHIFAYKDFSEFRGRIVELTEKVSSSVEDEKRDAFQKELGPALDNLMNVLQKYSR